jgi:hypothetical protein
VADKPNEQAVSHKLTIFLEQAILCNYIWYDRDVLLNLLNDYRARMRPIRFVVDATEWNEGYYTQYETVHTSVTVIGEVS